jgi:prepilin-type N-terminal cleavage/methylation domain-containing protein
MIRLKTKSQKAFSLVELLIALAILLIVSATIISSFTNSLRVVRRETSLYQRDSDVKRAIELMSLELSQAGTTPDLIDPGASNPQTTMLQSATTLTAVSFPTTSANISITNTTAGITSPSIRGLYPGRTLIFGLPEGSTASQTMQVGTLPTSCTNPCQITVTNVTAKTHPANTPVTSPSLPLMFGILNPPPLTSGALPLTKLSGSVNRIGFVGDILSNGRLQYVEYTYDSTTQRLYRSLTPLSPNDPDNATLNTNSPNKAKAYVLLDNVLSASFTINYYSLTVPIPVSVGISIQVRNAVPEKKRGTITTSTADPTSFSVLTSSTEVVPRGTAAAAFIFANNAEPALRMMMPPCNGTTPGTGYAPCNGWNTNNWPWWNKVVSNFTATGIDAVTTSALPTP